MTPERWRSVQTLFHRALELAPSERAKFLEKACADDPDLRGQVDALLDADANPPGVLGASVDDLAGLIRPGDEGRQIGPYRIDREIGRGGMGRVYLADRADGQFDQQVALKVIYEGAEEEHITRRFLSERQILASLKHPNIARLYDGGRTDDGRPYLVMEYVRGRPIDRFSDEERLSIDDRLRLFMTVCDAVQCAHQNLVVHRDLKPSNVLVGEDGQVKLLDFGIAKPLFDESDAPALTKTGVRVMTPEYAAPEQMEGRPITTATDVYALGVLLYELLTGRRPYDVSNMSAVDAERAVLESEPERPSTAVTRSIERRHGDGTTQTIVPETVSAARATSVDRLQRKLRGDLDRILLKALRKEPERRYASADAFLDDIKRHLDGLPVRARPDTLPYLFRKFVRRNRVSVAAAVVVCCSLVAGLGAALWQAEEARRERDTANEVSAFLEQLFDAADPFSVTLTERLDTLRIREFLDHGVQKVQRELVDHPGVQARMLTTLGRVHLKLGLYDQARPLLEQAVALNRAHRGDGHLETLESLGGLADVLHNEGKHEEASPIYKDVLAAYRELFGETHPRVAAAMNNLALNLQAEGAFDEAEGLHRAALAINRRELEANDPEVAVNLNQLAGLLIVRGDYDSAEPLFLESLELRRKQFGDAHPSVAVGLNNLAVLYRDQGRYADAEPLLRDALDINRRAFGGDHPHVADNLSTLGSVLRRKGDFDEADAVFKESIGLARRMHGDHHPTLSVILDTYAALLREKGDFDEAERVEQEAIDIARDAFGDDHFAVAITTSKLAGIVHGKGDFPRAEGIYRDALARMERHFDDDHPNVVLIRVGLANCLADMGRFAAAEPLLLTSYRALHDRDGDEHRYTQRVLESLVALYDGWNRRQLAETYRSRLSGS